PPPQAVGRAEQKIVPDDHERLVVRDESRRRRARPAEIGPLPGSRRADADRAVAVAAGGEPRDENRNEPDRRYLVARNGLLRRMLRAHRSEPQNRPDAGRVEIDGRRARALEGLPATRRMP